jgi:hypothetical protein
MEMSVRTILREEVKRVGEPLAVATSNGVDSKAIIISAVEDLGYRPTVISMTLNDRESKDFRGARSFAQEYDLDFIPIRLPTDAATIERDIVTLIRTHKVFGKTSIECNWGMLYVFDELRRRKICSLVTGHQNSHFQTYREPMIALSRAGLLNSRNADAVRLFQNLRHKAFDKPNAAGVRDLQRIGKSYGVTTYLPYRNPEMFNLWSDKAWVEVNKPKQKYPIRVAFPALHNNEMQSQMQLGDSGIRDLLGEIAIRRWKPTAKSSIAAYNVVAGRPR